MFSANMYLCRWLLTDFQEPISVDDIIARRKLRATSGKRKRPLEDEGDQEEDDAEEDEEDSGSSVDEEDEDGSEGSEDGFEGVSEEYAKA